MERLSCLQSIQRVEDHPYPHVFTEAALPEAIYSELEATFPEEQILNRVQRMDDGSPPDVLKPQRHWPGAISLPYGRTFCGFTPVPSI